MLKYTSKYWFVVTTLLTTYPDGIGYLDFR